MKLRPLVVAVFAMALPALVNAADLMDVYREAAANDAQFSAARAQFDADQERVVQSRAGLLPTIGASANLTRNYVDRSGQSANAFTSNNWGVQLTQPIFRMQNRIAADQGALQGELAEVQLEIARQELALRVAEAYFAVLNAQDALDALSQLQTAAAEQREIAQTSFEVGTVTITDVHEAQSRFDLASAQVIAAQSDLDVKRDALARIIGSEPGELARLRPEVSLSRPMPENVLDWAAAAESGGLGVQVQHLVRDVAGKEAARASAGHYPTVDLVASQNWSHRQGGATTPRTSAAAVGIQLNVPLYAGGAISSREREAASLLTKADFDLEDARRSASMTARQAYSGVTSGLARIKALEAAEVSSLSALEATRLGFEVGVRINIDVLNAQSQLADTRRQLASARYDTLIAKLRLKAAAGTLDEQDLETVNNLLSQR